jgi:hypothetical protein
MPASEEARRADRYAWPGAEEQALEVTCARIARHLSLAHPRTVGFLPIGGEGTGRGARTLSLAPLLSRVAGQLIGFVTDDVAIIDSWRTWSPGQKGDGEGDGAGAGPASRIDEIQPRVLDVMPPPCKDAMAAAAALRNTLGILRRSVSVALVHLGGYAPVGIAPSTLNMVDGVVLVVSTRRTHRTAVAAMAEQLPAGKQLGAILVG